CPQSGTCNATVTAPAAGGRETTVTPATGTIPAAQVTSDLSTTGYVQFTINRPSAGAGTGRVTFTASRSGRVSDVDAVDVPELPQMPTQIKPRVGLAVMSLAGSQAQVLIRGITSESGAVPTQYRWRQYTSGATPPAYSSWLPLDAQGEATVTATRL